MNLLIYFGIFLFKIIEDALATLRLIVVSNERKIFGAILQFIITIIWVILTGSVLVNFLDDPWKIVAFSLGSLFGSYVGCVLEEVIAFGTNNYIIKIKDELPLINCLKLYNYNYFRVNSYMFMIAVPRRQAKKFIELVRSIDNKAEIMCEKIKYICH